MELYLHSAVHWGTALSGKTAGVWKWPLLSTSATHEVSGRIHILAALAREESPVPAEQEPGWVSEPAWPQQRIE
jgi:hypothetical protein